ncbi:hypothetical protein BMS3Bbin11_01149 [bacterium BMS3Bbin11]|nr:hypothetical protein BMS3Abin11_00696 [bacterium BMS3Abin11]GBE46054.1 hypothetical protein BMS3Bbin11_01149 [bacterium BMS3Bbin11]GMT39398.1 MAG: hypothetical protein IEMM0001_0133 [bacterium]
MADGARQMGKLGAGGRLDPAEPGASIGMVSVHTIEEQHMEMDIQIECRAKPLDEGDRPGPGCLFCQARFLDQMGGNHTVDNAEHPARDGRVDYQGARLLLRHRSTRSSRRAVPAHITVSAPPQ